MSKEKNQEQESLNQNEIGYNSDAIEVETKTISFEGGANFGSPEDDLIESTEISAAKDTHDPSERMQENADLLISGVLGSNKNWRNRQSYLFTSARPELFRDENHIIYKILYHFRENDIKITDQFVRLFLQNNRKILKQSAEYIDLPARATIEQETDYIASVVKQFSALERREPVKEEEFSLAFETYLLDFELISGKETLSEAMDILLEGKGKLSGFKDAFSYVGRKSAEVQGLMNASEGTGFTSLRDVITKTEETSEIYKISDFGAIEELNQSLGGIYSGNVITVVGPTKGGKTRFCAARAYDVITKSKLPVTVWAHEGGNTAFSALLRAIHFDHIYNSGEVDITKLKTGIDDSVILENQFPSKELQELELVSARELAGNLDYGNLDFIDRPFLVETFIEEIDTSVKKNGSSLIIIDYPGLIQSRYHSKVEHERVKEAYQKMSDYCKRNNVSILAPAQYKQEAITVMDQKGPGENEIRNAIASSAEVFRSSDTVMALWATSEDLRNNRMTFKSLPSRRSKPFPEFEVATDLGICYFGSIVE